MDQLELQFYETQRELYDTKFEILKSEEQLLVAQIDTVRRQIRGDSTTASHHNRTSHTSTRITDNITPILPILFLGNIS